MLRWLVPIVTVLALLGQSVAAYAAAGVFAKTHCCCPSKAKCKCPHDGKPDSSPTMKRCQGEAKIVAPAPALALPALEVEITNESRIAIAPTRAPAPLHDSVATEPEKPPF